MKKILLLLLITVSLTSFGQYKGKITKVYDGNTFWVKLENGDVDSVKFWGIDCPELKQQYGVAAREHLEDQIHREVDIEYKGRDKDNYILGIVKYKNKKGEEIILNEEHLENGYAWKNKYTDDKRYEKLEKQARKSRIGLWRNDDPTPPWEFRKKNK